MVMTIKSHSLKTTPKINAYLSACLLMLASLSQTAWAATTLDKIAAIVNDDVVMLSDVYTNAKRLKANPKFANIADDALIKESLELLIIDSLQMQKAKQLGIEIDDAALNTTMEDLARQNNLTLEQFQVALKREGLEYNSFRERIRQRLLISELRKSRLRRNTKVTNQEVDDLIANQSGELTKGTEYRVQQAVVPAKTGTPLAQVLAAKNSAQRIRDDLIAGKDPRFNNTSSVGWKAASAFPTSYIRTLALLEPGQISDVFQDPEGFHVIKLLEKRGAKKIVIEEFNARHILIKTDSTTTDAQAKTQLNELRHRILAGADFAKLAKQYSKDTGSAVSGGELGWAPAETFVPAFANALKNTPVNQISQPFKSKFGWHIVQSTEKRTIDKTEALLRNQAKGMLNKGKVEEEYDSWLKQLRNDAFVTYRIKL